MQRLSNLTKIWPKPGSDHISVGPVTAYWLGPRGSHLLAVRIGSKSEACIVKNSFPSHPDELSSAWLSDVLGYAVHGYEVTYFSEGAGVMAWVTRLLLQTDAGNPSSIIAKFPSPAQANRDVAAVYNMYGREVQYYQEVNDLVDLRAPACFHAALDEASQDFVLLLEDLGDMRIGDQVEGCSLQQAKSVIDTMAKFHASTWTASEFPQLSSHNNEAQREGMKAGYAVGWPVVLEQFGEQVPNQVRKIAGRMPEAVDVLLERMCQPPVCLSHADVRLDNIFFSAAANAAGGHDVALVDWQSVCTSAPEHDVAYFITQSLAPQVREQEDLIAYYHQQLVAQGVDYSQAQCRERFRVCALYLLCYAVVISGTLDLGNDRGQALGRTIVGNTFSSLRALDAFSLLEELLG